MPCLKVADFSVHYQIKAKTKKAKGKSKEFAGK
jgi:hypothetical protein